MAVLTLALGLSGAPNAGGLQGSDPVKDRERVRQQRAAVASRLNVQKASLAKIDSALQALSADLSAQEARLIHANQELADARTQFDRATDDVAEIEKRISHLVDQMRARAVAAYMNPPGDQAIDLLRTASTNATSFRQMYGQIGATSDADAADELRGARSDLVVARRSAATARHVTERKRATQQARTRSVGVARSRQLRFAAQLKARINSSVGEAIRLARTDKALSARIALEQAALEARLAAARRAAALAKLAEEAASTARAVRARAAAQQQANRAAAAVAARENTFRSNGSEARALPPVQQSAVPVSTSAGISLATVGGITVAAQIAGPLQALLSAARAGGLTLTGGGYRSSAQQVTLRAAHCGASYYAIYQMSAGSCHPPTAPPGQSMHEVGLAIDFSNCSSHGTACYRWLSANASRFGFYNLPSEPWHWSINGH